MSLRLSPVLALVIARVLFYALLLFGGAGTLRWPNGWIFLALYAGQLFLTDVLVNRLDPELGRERRMPGNATAPPGWDRRFLLVSALIAPVWMVLMAFDSVRFGWSHLPGAAVWPGAALILIGSLICYAGLRANRFASPIVRIQ